MKYCTMKFIKFLSSFRRGISSMKVAEIYATKETDKPTTVKGWIRSIRYMKSTVFLDLNDGSTYKFLQIVVRKRNLPATLKYGSAVEISGKLVLAPSGQLELQSENINVIGSHMSLSGYPFTEGVKYLPEEQRPYLHFRPRTRTCGSLLRIRSHIIHCVHEFFHQEKFVNIHTPILTSNDCEGAGEIFKAVPESKTIITDMKKHESLNDDEAFFDTMAFLTVSGQLHLEVMARALYNVYQFGPVFRAENNKSRFHLTEFYMIEAEMAFTNTLEELIQFIEKFIKKIFERVLETQEEEITNYRNLLSLEQFNVDSILNKSYTIMTYSDACQLLQQDVNNFCSQIPCVKHLTKEHELSLLKHNNNVPIFLVDWPVDKKPFYVKISPSSGQAAAVDLLFPDVGELCGGSLREDDCGVLEKKLAQHKLSEKLNWYLELRKFGNVPTAGFGMGFERFLKALLGTNSIKDTIPFPRWPHNCRL